MVSDAVGEWFEVYNPGDKPIDLNGVELKDKVKTHTINNKGGLVVPAKGYAVLGLNAKTTDNGGAAVAYAYPGLALSNSSSGGVMGLHNADGSIIDQVKYQTSQGKDGWPGRVSGVSYSLRMDRVSATANDVGASWCLSPAKFGKGDKGSPGKANPACFVGWCRLQSPLNQVMTASGPKVTWYGRVFAKGVTDKTDAVDAEVRLKAAMGYGPVGSAPIGNKSWKWRQAVPNGGWSAKAANEPGNDEYQAILSTLPAAGTYDTAYRFSLDGGHSWEHCDKAAGVGKDGSEDGYDKANAGKLKMQ